MSVNFSTITPMTQATISKAPAFSVNTAPAAAEQPAASSPMDGAYGQPKKKSHWFIKTLAAVVVVGAALGLGRKYGLKDFDVKKVLDKDATGMQKFTHTIKKWIAQGGDFVNEKIVGSVLNLFKGKKDKVAEAGNKATDATTTAAAATEGAAAAATTTAAAATEGAAAAAVTTTAEGAAATATATAPAVVEAAAKA